MNKTYDIKLRCYHFHYGFLWVGWILIIRESKPVPFYSAEKTIVIEPEANIEYLTLGFTQKGVFERVKRKAISIVGG